MTTKTALALALTALNCFPAFADSITGAVADPDSGELLVGVTHTGCARERFTIRLGQCAQSMPLQCHAIVESPRTSGEICQQEHEYVARFDAKRLGLTVANFSGAQLTLHDRENRAAITITLPVSWKGGRQ